LTVSGLERSYRFDRIWFGGARYFATSGRTGDFSEYYTEHLPVSFHGTGDIYSSAAVGALVNGMSVPEALALAADYTVECIRLTLQEKDHSWYGVNFEQAIPYLLWRMKK
jgi:pyridoxine kinase